MDSAGRLLVGLGGFSALLSFINYELVVLMWIENWGSGVAWLIRFALFAAGAALIMAAGAQPEQPYYEAEAEAA